MADFFEKANAIWKALDDMADNDPNAYKKFVTEQLQNGGEILKSQQQDKDKKAKGNSDDPRRNLSTQNPANLMEMMMGQLSGLNFAEGAGDGPSKMPKPNKTDKLEKRHEKSAKTQESAKPKTELLDDTIGKSLFASIVSDETKKSKNLDAEDNKDDFSLTDIKLPFELAVGNTKKSAIKKPLIEEL